MKCLKSEHGENNHLDSEYASFCQLFNNLVRSVCHLQLSTALLLRALSSEFNGAFNFCQLHKRCFQLCFPKHFFSINADEVTLICGP
mmetsp:Transcript_13696/g.17863  ORF Transcript_13696/g.17863 Transcript_13696/m.17863 type:complete len:87 (+) Transcript_13696:460-720(+)